MNCLAALRPEAFEARYQGGRDPWAFAQSPYELARYRTLLDALQRRRYMRAYEPGCSVGVLTEQLAAVASHVIAVDFSASAVAQTHERCRELPNIEVLCADLAHFFPRVPLDLIVFSEVGYYFPQRGLSRLVATLANCLIPGGEFIAVHWLGSSADHLLHGTEVHEILCASLPLRRVKHEIHPGFRLDSWIQE